MFPAGQKTDALLYILNGTLNHLSDDITSAGDGLFCEFVYWIDFEKKILEIEGGYGGDRVRPDERGSYGRSSRRSVE